MYSEILDDNSEDKRPTSRFVWRPRLVLAILWAIVIYRFIDFPYFDFKLIWSVIGLSVATYYVVIGSSISIYATFILLGLGMTGTINHFATIYYVSVGPIPINLNYLVLIVLHAFLNSKAWLALLQTIFTGIAGKEKATQKPFSQNSFILKFKNKTDDELKRIIESPQYSKEAVETAKEILNRRQR